MSGSRPYDIVIYGATGFTGGLVAEYFARHVPLERTRWALAGRNREKLEAVRSRLVAISPRCAEVPIVLASSDAEGELRALAESTRVVLTTVGPFALHGEALFAECVRAATDYVDSTGEPSFVKRMRERHAEGARRSGAILVSCCGVDSIPTDLGAYFTMRELVPSGAVELEGHFSFRARPSGGTWHSVLEAMREAPQVLEEQRKPIEAKNGRRVARAPMRLRREESGWLVPFPTIDPEIALRSAAQLPIYGPDFSYGHYLRLEHTTTVLGLGIGASLVFGLSQLELTRRLLASFIDAGDGPSQEERDKSWFRLRFIARHAGDELHTEISGGDPGYGETAKMLSESALCLAEDRDKLPARAGVLTPAVAFGDVLIHRLVRAGMSFRVLSQ